MLEKTNHGFKNSKIPVKVNLDSLDGWSVATQPDLSAMSADS